MINKRFKTLYPLIFILTVSFSILFLNVKQVVAETDLQKIEDGVYSMDYVILHAQNDSASIANDYFEKPAYLIVREGERYIRFEINHSNWTKELQAPLGDEFIDVQVISEDEKEDTRVVQFKLDRDLNEPLEFKMHVLIETMDPVYDHRYTIRFDFDMESLKELEESEIELLNLADRDFKKATSNENTDEESESKEANSESSFPILTVSVFTVLIIGGAIFIYIFKKKQKESNQ